MEPFDISCNAFYRLPTGRVKCLACTKMWCEEGGTCKFYGPTITGKLVSPCEECPKHRPGILCRCPELDAYKELLRRCRVAGVPPELDVKLARELHAKRHEEGYP